MEIRLQSLRPEDVSIQALSPEEVTRRLTYVGLTLLTFELLASMIIKPIKFFYLATSFPPDWPFKSYKDDVESLHKDIFEASLMYLRDKMQSIENSDLETIKELRRHRNELAHELVDRLPELRIEDHVALWERVNQAVFKMSNYHTKIEIGADPDFKWIEDWNTLKGPEYLFFEAVMDRLKSLWNQT